jgi:hypothetical protein
MSEPAARVVRVSIFVAHCGQAARLIAAAHDNARAAQDAAGHTVVTAGGGLSRQQST